MIHGYRVTGDPRNGLVSARPYIWRGKTRSDAPPLSPLRRTCPECGAHPGTRCRTTTGHIAKQYHQARRTP